MRVTRVNMKKLKNAGCIKAIASIVLDEAICLKQIEVVEGREGELFILSKLSVQILYLLGLPFFPFSYLKSPASINLSLYDIKVASLLISKSAINLWLSTEIHSTHPHLLNSPIILYHNNCDTGGK
jgi:hypothetical protein